MIRNNYNTKEDLFKVFWFNNIIQIIIYLNLMDKTTGLLLGILSLGGAVQTYKWN